MHEEIVDNPLAIIGDEDIVSGLKALGFKIFPVKEYDDCVKALEEVARNKVTICFVQDNFYSLIKENIAGYKNQPLSVFIPFGKKGRSLLLDDMLRDIRLKATGAF